MIPTISITTDFASDPCVMLIAHQTQINQYEVIGRLITLWFVVANHGEPDDANRMEITEEEIDRIVDCGGFANAMKGALILCEDDDKGTHIFEFYGFNSQKAKSVWGTL